MLQIAGVTAITRVGELGGFKLFRGLDGFRGGFDELDRRSKCLE